MRWHPFQLNPGASQEGISKLSFYEEKFGKERTQQMIPFMTVCSTPCLLRFKQAPISAF